MKDEGSNLNTMMITLKIGVSYDILSLEESYQGTCFGHAFLKAYQYATGPITLLEAARAALDHYFILKIFLESF